jgi:hypothetical protein
MPILPLPQLIYSIIKPFEIFNTQLKHVVVSQVKSYINTLYMASNLKYIKALIY